MFETRNQRRKRITIADYSLEIGNSKQKNKVLEMKRQSSSEHGVSRPRHESWGPQDLMGSFEELYGCLRANGHGLNGINHTDPVAVSGFHVASNG